MQILLIFLFWAHWSKSNPARISTKVAEEARDLIGDREYWGVMDLIWRGELDMLTLIPVDVCLASYKRPLGGGGEVDKENMKEKLQSGGVALKNFEMPYSNSGNIV